MKLSFYIVILVFLLSSCGNLSLQKCRYSKGWNISLGRNKSNDTREEIKAKIAEKKQIASTNLPQISADTSTQPLIADNIALYTSDVQKHIVRQNHVLSESPKDIVIHDTITEINNKNAEIKSTHFTGISKTVRIILAVAGILFLLAAFTYIVLCIINASLPYLITAATLAAISYVLLYIGKRKLQSEIITLNRKEMKVVRKTAKWTAFIAGLAALIWELGLLFHIIK